MDSSAYVWRRLQAAISLSGNFERHAGTHNEGRRAISAADVFVLIGRVQRLLFLLLSSFIYLFCQ